MIATHTDTFNAFTYTTVWYAAMQTHNVHISFSYHCVPQYEEPSTTSVIPFSRTSTNRSFSAVGVARPHSASVAGVNNNQHWGWRRDYASLLPFLFQICVLEWLLPLRPSRDLDVRVVRIPGGGTAAAAATLPSLALLVAAAVPVVAAVPHE